MNQKMVIRVPMNDDKSRKKAMKIVVGYAGLESTAFKGPGKDQIEVIGVGIDAAKLTTKLRKKFGSAEIVSVEEKKGDDKKESSSSSSSTQLPVVWTSHPYVYNGVPYGQAYEFRDQSYDPFCSIM